MKSKTLLGSARFDSSGALSGLALLFSCVLIVFALSACSSDKSDGAGAGKGALEVVAAGDKGEMPEGHPTINDTPSFKQVPAQDHSRIKSTKDVEVSDEIRAMYKFVNLEITDRSTGNKRVVKFDIGASKELKDGFTLNAEVFLPDYTIFDDHIGSRSNEPTNPAVLVKLYKDKELVSSGWVFEELIEYNSYSHMRFAVVLMPTK